MSDGEVFVINKNLFTVNGFTMIGIGLSRCMWKVHAWCTAPGMSKNKAKRQVGLVGPIVGRGRVQSRTGPLPHALMSKVSRSINLTCETETARNSGVSPKVVTPVELILVGYMGRGSECTLYTENTPPPLLIGIGMVMSN